MRISPVNIAFFSKWKTNTMIDFAGFLDRFSCFWLLLAKLIAWKTQHNKSLVAVLLVQSLKCGKLWRKPAFCCCVYDQ